MLRQRIGSLSLSALAAAVTVAVPLAMVTTETAQAAQCYGYVTYHADGKSRSYAVNAAISGWSSYVASKYGKSYAYWSHAVYKSTWCSQYDYLLDLPGQGRALLLGAELQAELQAELP